MKPSVALTRGDSWSTLALYHIIEGFWKRSGYVSRMPQTVTAGLSNREPFFKRDPTDISRVDCQQDGPRLAFRSLLDSGATYPTLHTEDLKMLGIDGNEYGAQSVETLMTANGPIFTRLFELFVSVLDENGKQLVDANDPVYCFNHPYLGGLCPVVETPSALQYDGNGIEIATRLSGLLPFVACYVSSTPTRNMLFLGEDRNDVLGSHRMPGQKKWSIEMPPIVPGLPFDRYDNPKISFNHRKGMIIDEDEADETHASRITFLKGTANEHVVVSNPGRRQAEAQMAQAMAERISGTIGEEATLAADRQADLEKLMKIIADRTLPGSGSSIG